MHMDTPALVQLIAEHLIARGETLAVAESCTGGLVGGALTTLPGSSAWFRGGIIAYSNDLKENLLQVPSEVLATHGAVSGETARAMATGARQACGSDWVLAVTGIAGPGGGTDEKPVGLVWMALAGPDGIDICSHQFNGSRDDIRRAATHTLLHHFANHLPPP